MQVSKISVEGVVKAKSKRVSVVVEAYAGLRILLRRSSDFSFEEVEAGEHLKFVDKALTEATVRANVATAIAKKAEAMTLEYLKRRTCAEVKVEFKEVVE